jgi:ubiquinone/menaquinone biosynthesis C-methylase UbiE
MTTSEQAKEAKYAHGHHDSVLKSHLWRTVENSCAYLIPHIKPSLKILDIGCGPGTITCDLAGRVPEGSVIGMDRAEDVLDKARSHAASKNQKNVEFRTGNIFSLDFPDNEFDIVHCHQVLQHVGDATAALKEMRRVTKPGGIVAAREMCEFLHYPQSEDLERFRNLFFAISKSVGGTPDAGIRLPKFTREAGFERESVAMTSGTWCYNSQEDLDWWCGMWAERILASDYKANALKTGLTSEEELVRISEAFKIFAKTQDAVFIVVHGEVVCTK